MSLRWLSWSALLLVFAVATSTQADPDLWGHLRFGLDMLNRHALPSVDTYSFTQDVPWVNHEWLSELMIGAAWRLAGVAGLALLKGALAATAVVIVWLVLRGSAFEARMIATMTAAIGILPLARTLRPQVWTVLGLAVLLAVLIRPGRDKRWWLPVVFVLWANAHGGWVAGIGVLVAWLVFEGGHRFERAALVLLCALGTLLTPYGWTLWRFLFDSVGTTRANIEDWTPVWRLGPSEWLIPALAAGAALWLVAGPQKRRWSRVAALALLAYGGARVARVAPLFVEAAAILLSPVIVARWPAKPLAIRTAMERSLVAVACAVFVAASAAVFAVTLRCVPIDVQTLPDQAVADALSGAPPGKLVLFFNWGEYAIWHFGPAIRVSMDGRRETVYSARRLAEHDAILRGTPDGLAVLGSWRPEYVWLPASSTATKAWLVSHDYRIDVDTPRSFLAVRDDLPPRVRGGRPAAPRPCFPN